MTTSSVTVALQPRALDDSELDTVGAGNRGAGAAFGGLVGWIAGEAVAVVVSVLTCNPAPIVAYQVITAAAGVGIGAAITGD